MKKKIYCYVGVSCIFINCCIEDFEMDIIFNWFIDVDFCYLKFLVGIENRK